MFGIQNTHKNTAPIFRLGKHLFYIQASTYHRKNSQLLTENVVPIRGNFLSLQKIRLTVICVI